MNKDLPYLKCLKCGKRIYADQIEFRENNNIVVCPHCSARNIVSFHRGDGGILMIEFHKLDE